MKKIDSIKSSIAEKTGYIHEINKECDDAVKKTGNSLLTTAALSLGTVIAFNGLKNVMDGSDLVLVCLPAAVGVITTGALTVMNYRKANSCYEKLHDLDVEVFDLKFELMKMQRKNIPYRYGDLKKKSNDEDINMESYDSVKKLKKDFI